MRFDVGGRHVPVLLPKRRGLIPTRFFSSNSRYSVRTRSYQRVRMMFNDRAYAQFRVCERDKGEH